MFYCSNSDNTYSHHTWGFSLCGAVTSDCQKKKDLKLWFCSVKFLKDSFI